MLRKFSTRIKNRLRREKIISDLLLLLLFAARETIFFYEIRDDRLAEFATLFRNICNTHFKPTPQIQPLASTHHPMQATETNKTHTYTNKQTKIESFFIFSLLIVFFIFVWIALVAFTQLLLFVWGFLFCGEKKKTTLGVWACNSIDILMTEFEWSRVDFDRIVWKWPQSYGTRCLAEERHILIRKEKKLICIWLMM